MKALKLLLIELLALGLLAGPAITEAEARPDQRDRRVAQKQKAAKTKKAKKAERREKKRAKLRQKFRAARAWKLTEALELDEETSNKLFPILNEYDKKFEKVHRRSADLRRGLRAELDSANPNNKKIDRIVDQMLDNQREIWKLSEQRFAAVRKVLSPTQAAKALILLPEIDRAMHRKIHKVMRRDRRGGKRDDRFDDESRRGRRRDR